MLQARREVGLRASFTSRYTGCMPSVNDIANVAEALQKCSIDVVRDRCVAVRNRNATCRRCVEACPAGAIEVGGNELYLDPSPCVACGACSTACPTEALVPLDPTDALLEQAVGKAMAENGNRAVFACARISSRHVADPRTYVEVPCLPRVDEAAILAAAEGGADEILLVDGDCATCKFRDCSSRTDATLASANGLLAAHGCAIGAKRVTGFPDDLLVEDAKELFGTTRRGFFSDAVGAARDTAVTAAKTTLEQELGQVAVEPEIGERLRVTEGGTLPIVSVPRHDAVINALDALGGPQVDEIDSRLFGSVAVDVAKCNACGMCAMFCPTGALRRDAPSKPGDPLRRLEFSACDCVQCGLCADVCWKAALTLDTRVSADELFDFEPRAFEIPPGQSTTNSLFGKSRRN